MADTVASDHETVATSRARVRTVGGTSRPEVDVSSADGLDPGAVVWWSLEGETGYGAVATALDDTVVLRAVRANRRQAREREGPDRLREWLRARDVEPGAALLVDTLTAGEAYGLRRPGERVLYRPPAQRDGSLADIARDVAGEGE